MNADERQLGAALMRYEKIIGAAAAGRVRNEHVG
jgi:hypothetical protein